MTHAGFANRIVAVAPAVVAAVVGDVVAVVVLAAASDQGPRVKVRCRARSGGTSRADTKILAMTSHCNK